MKIALCFYGNVGTFYLNKAVYESDGDIDYRIGYRHWKNHVLDKNDVDVFIHSWSTQYKYGIINSYKPKKHLVEEQKVFDAVGTNELGSLRKEVTVSRWYSVMESIRLKKEYEEEKSIEYDLVISARLDWAWLVDIDFSIYTDTNLFYSPNNNNFMERNPKLDDWLFFSNSKNMDDFSKLYQKFYVDNDKISNPKISINSHHDSYTFAKECGFDVVLTENLRDGVEGMYVRALYKNCKFSTDYKFDKLELMHNGNNSKRF